METNSIDYQNISGWAMDADPENEPTYPMKQYTGDDHLRIAYERGEQQPLTVEILKSTERPAMTTVFGTRLPPTGLSGQIRRYAFKHSEDRYRHWIPLILADRINMIEGIIDDFSKGYAPNFFKERGLKMEMKHNPKGFAVKMLTGAAVATFLYLTLFKSKKK